MNTASALFISDTIRGLIQLRRFRVRIELRFVIHRLTVPRLRSLAEFVACNLTFVKELVIAGCVPLLGSRIGEVGW